ncbi:MAG: type II toxin-antitoxin system RelE/ParE family toxin [Chromatiales bacterium]|jgi:toxin ParE1/3/4|nr:type II toxin-antitoxin system RelE/ParE family toxin [Chromatiales bacterium]
MAQIRWTREAQRWLEDIFEYIAAENPKQAGSVASGIYERTQILETHPKIGYRYEASSRHVRVLLYGHYRIADLVNEDRSVDILGVLHGGLDLGRYSL